MLPKAPSFVVAKTAFNTGAARKQRTNSTFSSRVGLLAAHLISLDQYGRTVATCTVGDTDLGHWLVSNGLALDWPNYSKGMYDAIQSEAEHAGRGLWSGSYVAPWFYRACIRAGGRPAGCSDDANAHP